MSEVDRPPPLLQYEEKPPRRWLVLPDRAILVKGGIAAAGLAVLAIAIVMAYDAGHQRGSKEALPVVAADPAPTRVQPDSPGGLQIPHQDKLVYQRVSPAGVASPGQERVLPAPEEPMAKPAPEPPAPTLAARAPGPARTPETGRTSNAVSAQLPPTPPPAALTEKRPPIGAPGAASAPAAPPVAQPPSVAGQPPPVAGQPPPATAPRPAAPPAQVAAAPAIPAPPATAGGGFRVQLGSFKSETAASEGWRRVAERHKDVLAGQPMTVARADLGGDKGIVFRVQVGNFATRDDAARLCDYLKERRQDCLIVRP
jgi:hypothetical protein